MREAGRSFDDDVTALMHVVGIIFDNDISACGSNAARLARAYEAKYGTRIGSPATTEHVRLRRPGRPRCSGGSPVWPPSGGSPRSSTARYSPSRGRLAAARPTPEPR